jgi:hypothetical protein
MVCKTPRNEGGLYYEFWAGRIEVESVLGKGWRFNVLLPLCASLR